MAFILNQYDVEDVQIKAAHDHHRPNVSAAALTLARLVEWVNDNSDGWAYWTAPTKAATKLQTILTDNYIARNWQDREDITARELKAAYTPIKSFLTRQGVAHSVIFVNE